MASIQGGNTNFKIIVCFTKVYYVEGLGNDLLKTLMFRIQVLKICLEFIFCLVYEVVRGK